MWLALLVLSWFVEGVVGVWFCYHYWMFTQLQYEGVSHSWAQGTPLYRGTMLL